MQTFNRNRSRLLLLTACLLGLLSGCATPDYLLPGGYSSTFHKAVSGTPIPAPTSVPPVQP